MNWQHTFQQLLAVLLFSIVGIAVFVTALRVMQKVSPFSISKELSEDHNVALGVVMGAVLLGLAIIIAAAITG